MRTIINPGCKRMSLRSIAPKLAVAGIFLSTLLSGSVVSPHVALAKHKKTKNQAASNSDPCAEPTAFVKDHIAKIRALRATITAQPNNTVFSIFSSKPHVDPETYPKIAELRRDAEAVNAMLRSGNCPPIDIDEELRSPTAAR
jgi:hypothetical protein